MVSQAPSALSPVALELRVHGVHNTPPASMLGIDKGDLQQVAGDRVTGCYRSASGLLPYRLLPPGLAVEAYSWGALTSGIGGLLGWLKRALWLLLLPFALANMAYWARLRAGSVDPAGRRPEAASATRAASLLLTVFLVVVACTLFVDLIGWQCFRGDARQCAGLPSWTGWMGEVSTGQRLAIGALGPLAVVALLCLLTNRSQARYERVTDPMQAGLRTQRASHVLLHPDLFDGALRTSVLRDAHLAAALATVAGYTSVHAASTWLGAEPWQIAFVALSVVAASILVVGVVVVAGSIEGDLETHLVGRWTCGPRAARLLVRVALVLTVVALAALAAAPERFDSYADYTARNAWFVVLFVAVTVLHLCVFLVERVDGAWRAVLPILTAVVLGGGVLVVYAGLRGRPFADRVLTWQVGGVAVVVSIGFACLATWHYRLAHRSRTRAGAGTADAREREVARSAFAGAGASVLLAAAAWTSLLFASAAVIGAANLLNGGAPVTALRVAPLRSDVVVSQPFNADIGVPQVMLWAPLAQTLWLVVVALAVILCLRRFRPARLRILATPCPGVPVEDEAGVRRSRAGAALVHRAERILDAIGFVTSPLALALIVVSAQTAPPWRAVGDLVVDVSLYVVVATAAGLVVLGSQVRTSDSVRRAVGVIWDLSTFWPRAAHPLAPPCYAERVVPEISRRVDWALRVSEGRLVVLSGHSQGSLIVTTVAARLPDLERVRMITYGSQVRALYGRFFPAVFGPDVIGYVTTTGPTLLARAEPDLPTPVVDTPAAPPGSVRDRFLHPAHWTNLFRRADPLGFRVFSDDDSVVDVPTLEVPPAAMGDSGPPVKGHSDYQHSPEYRGRLQRWTHEDFVGYPTSTTDVLPLPPP